MTKLTVSKFDDLNPQMAIARLKAAGLTINGARDRRSYWAHKDPTKYGTYDPTWLTALPVQDLEPQDSTSHGSWTLSNWMSMPTASVDEIMCVYPSLERAVDSLLTYYFGQPTVINGWVCPLHRHPELLESTVRGVLSSAVPLTDDQFALIKRERAAMFWADVAARTPPLFLQWDEQHRTASQEGKENVGELDEWLTTHDKTPPEGSLPLGSPYKLGDVSYPYWEFMIRSQFVPVRHLEDPSRTLCLRRDLQEAYIVGSR